MRLDEQLTIYLCDSELYDRLYGSYLVKFSKRKTAIIVITASTLLVAGAWAWYKEMAALRFLISALSIAIFSLVYYPMRSEINDIITGKK